MQVYSVMPLSYAARMIQMLFPDDGEKRPLTGTYLELELHREAKTGAMTLFANFITSLDGRISMLHRERGEFGVPASIANERDWRLYQELAAQSDVMITSARYFRQLAKGCAQDLLPVGAGPQYADLQTWRIRQGLRPQPDVAIVSNSLDIPAEALAQLGDRRVLVITSKMADPERICRLQEQGIEVFDAGARQVAGDALKRLLAGQGYRAAYMIAGPQVHRTLIAAGAVDYLFLTTRHLLLGGNNFHTMLEGDLPDNKNCELELTRLCYDRIGRQSFAQYRINREL